MKYNIYILMICLLGLFACRTSAKKSIDDNIMVQILTDIHIAEAYVQYIKNDSTPISRQDSIQKYMSMILSKYKVTQKEFSNEMAWYKNNPSELDSMYSKVISKFSLLEHIDQDTLTPPPTSPISRTK